MANDIPDKVHQLLRQVVPEVEDIVNTYLKEDLKQNSTISREYVYNRSLRKIMHNYENSFPQDINEIVEHITTYTCKRIGQIYYDAWEYKHKGMNIDRLHQPSIINYEQPYQIMYERPFVYSGQQELQMRPFAVDHWFSSA
tara:strand:+ start:221 stop:643 length:423 start_codon:yes stop_codon:yes gene_type:complete